MERVRNPGRATSPMLVTPIATLAALAVALVVWPHLLVETSFGDFILVSLILGGATAWRTGQAVARSWGSFWNLVAYVVLLAGAVRFCHFALFEDTLFSLQHFVMEFLLLMAVAALGFRFVRRQQMTAQYGWMFEAHGPFAWRERSGDAPGDAL
ncbi:DUF6867 family protein [Xanthobacter tagetidis]|jgi:hypothetical protein|uniref:DUF6867 domain-containing protein n=1 Tax=Xanthobacter tagetidis TaxID=60216 RepID=A0A3L6ZVB7_9HYPH|nr:hypothetical protein [Xanthobacter tagetidis]MBB6310307.1 hypothetical protein [Xanthobacter tagetidis]RLP71810.1 hypothetical protein D9R14_22185 [Xanthobacter tagetidis]